VAERKRRDEDDAADNLDELFDDAVDDDALDDDDLEDQDDLAEPVTRPRRGRGGGTATKARPKAEGARPVKKDTDRVGVFGRLGRFVREVVAELRKVIWPTRKELLTYTAVVIVFVAVVLTIVGLLDLGFAKAVLWVFGGGGKQ
jgi:preprotein translocase subunit SecE